MIKKPIKYCFLFLMIGMIFPFNTFGQKNKKIKAYLDLKQYYSPVHKNYIEFNIQIIGRSAVFINDSLGSHAEAAIEFEIFKNDTLLIKDSYLLLSPIFNDSTQDNFYDIQKFALEPGDYVFNLKISDVNNLNSKIESTQNLQVKDFHKVLTGSDVLIAEMAYPTKSEDAFTKSGLHIIPFVSTYFPQQLETLPYYWEIYNLNSIKDSSVAFVQKIINAENGNEVEEYTFGERLKTAEVIPLFKTIDISNLKTGNYVLELSVVNKELDEIIKSEYNFQRTNEIDELVDLHNLNIDPFFQKSIEKDSVEFYLASLLPISNPAESKNIIETLKKNNEESSRKLIQSFWILTANKNSLNAYEEWMKYKEQVIMVERLYKTNFQNGHETDRGRVYLKYGAPHTVVSKEVSPSEYPYEIWTYNKIGIYSNKRFLFYNPDLVNNAYRLLHSDMLGERKTPGWAQVLSKRNTNQGDIDNPNKFLSPSVGNNSQDLFRQY